MNKHDYRLEPGEHELTVSKAEQMESGQLAAVYSKNNNVHSKTSPLTPNGRQKELSINVITESLSQNREIPKQGGPVMRLSDSPGE